jgi:hypothetical protein
MHGHDSSSIPTCAPNAEDWHLGPFAIDQISSPSICKPWVVVREDDARRRQMLWYLFSQYHMDDITVLVRANENTTAYFEAHCPGILVVRFGLSTPTRGPGSLHELADTLAGEFGPVRRPKKKNVAVILEDTPGIMASSVGFLYFHVLFCSEPWLGFNFNFYSGTRSYKAIDS